MMAARIMLASAAGLCCGSGTRIALVSAAISRSSGMAKLLRPVRSLSLGGLLTTVQCRVFPCGNGFALDGCPVRRCVLYGCAHPLRSSERVRRDCDCQAGWWKQLKGALDGCACQVCALIIALCDSISMDDVVWSLVVFSMCGVCDLLPFLCVFSCEGDWCGRLLTLDRCAGV